MMEIFSFVYFAIFWIALFSIVAFVCILKDNAKDNTKGGE